MIPTGPLVPGQSVTLTAGPTIAGQPGGVLPGPVTWSHMISPSSAAVLYNQSVNPTTVQVQTVNNPCTVTMTATSGNLTANYSFQVTPPPADGMVITPS